ncbi:MAG: class I SAM-dependent methyltransferase [Oscillospiraceae bacterium]|nr:class I SAM-dependent methyltransferase [Oscillospiraceae bacterium]
MKTTNMDGVGNVALFDEFHDIYRTSAGFEICETKTSPSEIFSKIKKNKTIALAGDYKKAESILWYVHHYENDLFEIEDLDYYKSFDLSPNCAAIKRFKVHRLNFLFEKNKMLLLSGSGEKEIADWLPEETGDQIYLLPARRYMRILTDMERAKEGIYFDFIDAKIHIAPSVYVPFDKSVPEMLLHFGNYIEGKNVIDIGTGTGILAILAAKLGAKSVTAADINPKAVKCAKENIAKNNPGGVSANVICSDLFGEIQGEFDMVIFNAPWMKGEPKNIYEAAIYDPGYKVIGDFFSQAKTRLSEDGAILLQYSDISQANGEGSMDNLNSLIEGNGLKIAETKSMLRKNRLAGRMERVYVFAVKNTT